jgi:hypothetical protein
MLSLIAIALPFSAIGGLMAFLITYEEMRHHFDRKRSIIYALKTAIIAFVVLAMLSTVAARLLVLGQG